MAALFVLGVPTTRKPRRWDLGPLLCSGSAAQEKESECMEENREAVFSFFPFWYDAKYDFSGRRRRESGMSWLLRA